MPFYIKREKADMALCRSIPEKRIQTKAGEEELIAV
jgi:hypothetical protein